MSLLDRLITLNLLEVNNALAKVENPEQVRDAVLSEISGTLEAAGAELRQLQRSRDGLLENRRTAEREVDEKRTALNAATEVDKTSLKKQMDALDEALVRIDEQIAEQNREEATLHKQVARLQDIRREASEWSPRRQESQGQAKAESGSKTSSASSTSSAKFNTTKPPADNVPAEEEEYSNDPFIRMKRLKEKMEAFQAHASSIGEEELKAFITEKAIAEEETRRVIEQGLSDLKKKMNRG
jgi:predicted metal-binding transcription factor (methanogenesis marker protein 9)